MEEEIFISASQINTWRECKRKWAWSRLDGVEGERNVYAEKGVVIHEMLEAWLKEAKPIDLDYVHTLSDETTFKPGPIAAAGLKHLPQPKTCGTERYISVQTEKVKYRGYIDFDDKNRSLPLVGDHKTTGDFKWAKTEDDLRKDPAATIYAAALIVEVEALTKKECNEVELNWIYYRTKGRPKSEKVSVVLTKAEVTRNFDDLDATALEIIEARQNIKSALELEPNPKACDSYGGCPYRQNCNLSTMDRMKAIMAQESLAQKMEKRKMATLAERMAARKAAAGPSTPPTKTAAEKPAAPAEATVAAGQINPPEGSTTRQETPPAPPTSTEAPKNLLKRPKASATAAAPAQAASSAALNGVVFTLYVDCVPTKFKNGVVVSINTKMPEGSAALAILEPLASEVVKALG